MSDTVSGSRARETVSGVAGQSRAQSLNMSQDLNRPQNQNMDQGESRETPQSNSQEGRYIVFVTGLSGAGKTCVLHAFEDLGFHVVDNLPLLMVPQLIDHTEAKHTVPLAVGIDARSLHFSAEEFIKLVRSTRERETANLHVLFIDAADETLVKRFSETRRRHPFATEHRLHKAIEAERALMAGVRDKVDALVDTTSRTSTDTRRLISARYRRDKGPGIMTTCMSFGYSNGVPRDVDLVFDVRFLRNPHYESDLKAKTGRDEDVASYVRADESFTPFVEKVENLLAMLLPRYQVEGKSYLTLAFGCTGGKHRSVMMAETFASLLSGAGLSVTIYHRDIPDDQSFPLEKRKI